ncbi:MAG: hypothetical protein V2J65_33470 [Desulfobacteraceae bacterium]|nr:hypothetical protein [Desulfobacteraceae bacterium]
MSTAHGRFYVKDLLENSDCHSLVRFSGDFCSSFVSPLFPMFIDKMGLSLALIGILAGTSRFLMFIIQPLSGYWVDCHPSCSFIL